MLAKINKLKTSVKDILVFRALLRKNQSGITLVASHTAHVDHIAEAQKLHASVYLARGFIRPEDVSPEGRMSITADPHQTHADYFIVTNSDLSDKIVAVSRQIRAGDKGFDAFPILALADITDSARQEISKYNPQKCVEISALSKMRGESSIAPLLLYREMLRKSLDNGDQLWLMACDVRLYRRLKILFGSSICQMGKVTHYYGGDVVPAMLKLDSIVPSVIKSVKASSMFHKRVRKYAYKFILDAFDPTELSAKNLQELKKLGLDPSGQLAYEEK